MLLENCVVALPDSPYLLNATVNKESRVTSLHSVDYPFVALFVSDIVLPSGKGHRDGMSGENRNRTTERDGRWKVNN